MKALKLIILILLLSSNSFSQNGDDIVIAKKMTIQSTVLDEERTIFVSTPSGYDQSTSAYPVMYVLDGSVNAIHFASGIVGNLSERALCPEMIIVSIVNTDRFRDMTPTPYTRDPNRPSGGADKFLQFIESELFPFIEKEYRTLPYRVFKGHSASGICVTYAFLSHNHMFNSYIAISPSMWWDSNLFSKTADEKIGEMNLEHKHFYFSTGSKETAHNIEGAQSFFEVLTKKNPADLQWKFDHIQNEDHMSQGTIAMYNALRFIFDGWKIDYQSVRASGVNYINDFYQNQSERYGYDICPSETEMVSFGYLMLRQKKYSEAIEIFERNILKNPQSANGYDCLGEAYLAQEEFDLSIKNYKKAVELGISNKDESLDIYKQNFEKAKNAKIQKDESCKSKVMVTHVGNSGFLINIGDKKILIDALFKGFKGDYELPQEIQDKLTLAQAPFDDVDLILVTHAHGDHVNPAMVSEHMKNNPNAIFASTKQLVDHMKDSSDRNIGFNPIMGKSDKKEIQGFSIETFLLPHGEDSRIINIGFLVSINGITLFHTGDVDFDQFTFEEFRSLKLPERKIDLSFIQHFYLTNDSISRQFVTKGIGSKYIFPIHYHFTTPSFDAAIVKTNYPDAILFDKELESWKMPERKEVPSKLIGESSNQTIVWKKLTSFPKTTSGAEPIVLNNKIYYAPSSYAPRSITSDFYYYDIPSDTWNKLANMPEAKGNLAVAEVSGEIYAIGGGFTKTNFKYSPEINLWKRMDTMPTARQHIDCGVVANKIYVIGGITSFKNITKKNEMYDPETNSWSEKTPIPTLRNNPAIITIDSLIYVIGGAGSESSIWETIATVECYNTKTDEWTTKADMPIKLFKPGAIVVEDKIVVLGGQDEKGKSLSSVLIYDIKSDTWERTTPLPQINCFAGYASVGNKIYVIGGTTSAPDWTYYSDVYEGTIINSSNKKIGLQTQSTKEFPVLKGDYLGQTPPGEMPVVFAPGIVSTNTTIEHGSPTFSPDGDEVFWQANSLDHKIIQCLTMKRIDNVWTKPQLSPYDSGPVFSPNGNRLYFLPFGEDRGEKDGPHYVDKKDNQWGEPVCLDLLKRFPEIKVIYNHSFTNNGTLYFLGHAEGYWNNFAIYRSELIDGDYAQPELLPASINIPGNTRNWTPFIAPDETYLLFSSSRAKDKTDTGDIYISFRNSDGSWTIPIYLDERINSTLPERFPSITPDGKYLFFTRFVSRGNEDVMWVSAKIIDELKQNESK